ncbi:MAG: outer membrane beta-barrel protein [Alphaproteobacteria bacterium]
MNLKPIVAGAALAVTGMFSAAAMAQDGFYVSGKAGANWLQDADVFTGPTREADFDLGYGVLGAVGYRFGQIRVEGELGFRDNNIDQISGGNGSGDMTSLSAMLNAIYDLGDFAGVRPYIGAGIGWARVKLDNAALAGTTLTNDSDSQFAYQGMIGFQVPLDTALSLDVGYRYFATLDPDFRTVGGAKFDSDYRSHMVMVGLTYSFGAPAPRPAAAAAPAPAPAPAPAAPQAAAPARPALPQTFIVFFDHDKSDITNEAASISPRGRGGQGRPERPHRSDRPARLLGLDAYNQRLSERRASRQVVPGPRGCCGPVDRHVRQGRKRPAGSDSRWRARAAEPPRRSPGPAALAGRRPTRVARTAARPPTGVRAVFAPQPRRARQQAWFHETGSSGPRPGRSRHSVPIDRRRN